MTCHQAIVWIDDQEACILRMENGLERESTIVAQGGSDSVEDPPGSRSEIGSETEESTGYFHRIARALDIADEILIVGPSVTKLEFVKFMHKDDHAIDPRILGVETIARPTDTRLAGFARLYFTVGGPRRPGNGFGNKKAD